MEPRMGDLESWINANFGKLNLNWIININQITNPPQFGFLVFLVSMETEKFQIIYPSKVWSSGLLNESPMCSFTLPDIFYLYLKNRWVYG